MTWADWITRHATLFGLQSEADLAMLREFASVFVEGGWTADQMHQASRDMALSAPPRFRADHLAGLLTAARTRKARETARAPSEGEIGHPGASCAICGGAGMLSGMPNPDSIQRGRWTTCAVRCCCAIGQWLGRQQGSRVLIGLDDYETLVPDWRERAAAEMRQVRAWQQARRTASGLDRAMGEILARMRRVDDGTD